MHPNHRDYGQLIRLEFSDEDLPRLNGIMLDEIGRVGALSTKDEFDREMDEACNKWTKAYNVLNGQDQFLHRPKSEAKWDMVIAFHRYWIAYESSRLNAVTDARKNLVKDYVVTYGGWLVAVVSAIFAILQYRQGMR